MKLALCLLLKKMFSQMGGKWVTFWLTNLKHLYQCWLQHPIHFYSPFLRHALSLHLEKRICPIFLSLPSNWQEIWYGSYWRAHLIIHAKNADSSGALMGTLSTWRKLIIILPFSHCFGDPYGLFSCGASQFESSDPGCLKSLELQIPWFYHNHKNPRNVRNPRNPRNIPT